MSILKTAVFLASRFDEFADLRRKIKGLINDYPKLQFTTIDLNDGSVSHRAPLVECLANVRRSEFMILLLGDTYGNLAPKEDKSFTHLEYLEALKEGSGTRVLVFGIGESYRDGRFAFSEDPRLSGWQREIEANHTVGFFDPDVPVEDIAKSIFEKLLAALYEMRFGEVAVDSFGDASEELFDALNDGSLQDDSEISKLDERNARGPSLVGGRELFTNTMDALTQPAAVAALEQREEAQRALDIGQYGVAVSHLKRALELKPLELISNYWLAQLYVALGHKVKAHEAMTMAERAGRIAESDDLPIRASSAYIIAARAAHLAGHTSEALEYTKKAVEVSPRFAHAHVELARQYALSGANQEALSSIREAFNILPRSLREVSVDPVFRPMRKDINGLIEEIKARVASDVKDLVRVEGDIAYLVGESPAHVMLEGKSILQIMEAGRKSSRRQYKYLCNLAAEVERSRQDACPEAPQLPPMDEAHLHFGRPGRAVIIEWSKQVNDIIEPGEVVFSYKYEGSSQVRPWSFRAPEPVRMMARSGGNGTIVSSEFSCTFEYMPASFHIAEPSQAVLHHEAIKSAKENVELSAAFIESTQNKKYEMESALRLMQNSGLAAPGSLALPIGFLALAISLYLFIFSSKGLGAFLLVVAIFILSCGYIWRGRYTSKVCELKESIAEQDQNLSRKLSVYNLRKQDLATLHAGLSNIDSAYKDAKMKMCKALGLFEKGSLRKGVRLLSFPSVYSAQTGGIVRALDREIKSLRAGSTRKIEIQDDMYEWLSEDVSDKPEARLLRVIEASPERLILSHRLAYSDVKEEL